MVAVKVDNEQIWNEQIKSGNAKGFSIEAYFANKLGSIKQSVDDVVIESAQLLNKMLNL